MSKELNKLNSDLILSFCQNFVAHNLDAWPPKEQVLANEFAVYFRLPVFITMRELERFCSATNIELTQKKLPEDLLAVNCSTNGKRIIELNEVPQDLSIQPHTVLHEVRELLEYTFRGLSHKCKSR